MRGLFLLGLGYIAGNIISEAYNKKTGKKYKKELAENENTFKFVLDNFLETQKHLFDDVKKEVTSEKNREVYEKYKSQILELFGDYKKKSEGLIEEIQKNGESYFSEAKKRLKKLYEDNKDKIDNLTDLSEEKASELKEKLSDSFEKSKKELKKLTKNKKTEK